MFGSMAQAFGFRVFVGSESFDTVGSSPLPVLILQLSSSTKMLGNLEKKTKPETPKP